MPTYHDTHVHLRKEGAYVDRQEEHDGEVLRWMHAIAKQANGLGKEDPKSIVYHF